MLPLKDTIRSRTFPAINWLLIAINALVFLYEINLSPAAGQRFMLTFGLVPARLDLLDPLSYISVFSHMFMHAGWFHFLSNMWVLFIFGDNVEDRLGSIRYLIFYLLSGVAAALIQVVVSPNSQIPLVGASGAIAGVLGAYFLFYPTARVLTFIPIFIFPWLVEIPAILFLGFWFVSQLFSGLLSIAAVSAVQTGGIAWWAHIGGFVFGLLTARLFGSRRLPNRWYPDQYYPW